MSYIHTSPDEANRIVTGSKDSQMNLGFQTNRLNFEKSPRAHQHANFLMNSFNDLRNNQPYTKNIAFKQNASFDLSSRNTGTNT